MTTSPVVRQPTPHQTARRRGGMPWPDARQLASELPLPLPPSSLPLPAAVGRALAADLVALSDLPVADASAMDGWVVAGRPPWRVVGDLSAGRLLGRPLADGECAAITTGAVVPAGADCVLPIEHSIRDAAGVRPDDPARPGRRHIRPRGEESRAGDVLLPAGTELTPPALGLAAAAGHDTVMVVPPATVDVLVLGDELSDRGLPVPGLIRDALGPQLPAWLVACGAAVSHVVRLSDCADDLDAAVSASGGDLVLTTGGTGPGPRDHVRSAVLRAGGRLVVDGVDVKPGHPMLLAAMPGGRWLAGLPGNPFAACAALVTLVQPLLDTLHGFARRGEGAVQLGSDQPGRTGDGHRLLPARREGDTAVVLPSCGSAMLRGLAQASGLVVIPPRGAWAGASTTYLPFPWCRS